METTPGIDYNAVLSDLKRRRDELDRAIAVLEGVMAGGLPSASTNGTGDLQAGAATMGGSGTVESKDGSIREDAFFGMNIATAAQKYLEMRKKPAPVLEIAEALQQGGLPNRSAKFVNTVNSVLTRNSKGNLTIFAKVKRGVWGLRAWYPNYRDKDKDDD